VNMRTAKIQLLQLLNDRTPIDQFDVSGPYDYADSLITMDEFQNMALNARPDLREALQNVELARLNHKLAVSNGSTDPTFGVDLSTGNPIYTTIGINVSIPLRIFDRIRAKRQERRSILPARTAGGCSSGPGLQRCRLGVRDAGGVLSILRPYKTEYLKLASDTRDKVQFAYQNGGASLIDYLDAEQTYRATRLAYLNLIGSYLTRLHR